MLAQMLVTMSIMGIILPSVLQVSMIPAVTQAKNKNFQEAELETLMFMPPRSTPAGGQPAAFLSLARE